MLGMRIEQVDTLQMVCSELGPGDIAPAHFACQAPATRLPRPAHVEMCALPDCRAIAAGLS